MFTAKKCLAIFGVFAIQTASSSRIVRSPDTMEVIIPNYSIEREGGEYQGEIGNEQAYCHGQGDKLGEKEKEGHKQLDKDRGKNEENYEHGKELLEKEHHYYNTDMNETYQKNKNKTEAHLESNQEHYNEHHSSTPNYHLGNHTEDLKETETVDRYKEKGSEYQNEGAAMVENYTVNGNSPSFNYTRD